MAFHDGVQFNARLIMKRTTLENCKRWLALAAGLAVTGMVAAGETNVLDADYFAALRSGDANELRAALDHGASANAIDARGNTALMWSAIYGNVETLQLLLDRGANVNATNSAGATALMRAATDTRKTALLLEHGANANARSASGKTALMIAARTANSHEAVEALLRHGADANSASSFGATPLMAAAAGGDAKSVQLLLDHGANPNAQPTPDLPGFIFGGGRSPLMWAAFRGDTEIMKLLIDAGADVNAPSGIGTPLAQAAWADRTDATQLLLEHGANPDIAGFGDGYAPLHWAASSEERNDDLVRMLLQHGANPNAGGGEPVEAFMGTPQTPLMLARRRGNSTVINLLVRAGATHETPDRIKNYTPPVRTLPGQLDADILRAAAAAAIAPLQFSSLESKKNFVKHESHQDCTSCHQQHLPMTAIGLARKSGVRVDSADEAALIRLVREGEMKDPEVDLQPLFHPDPAMTKGYEMLAYDGEDLAADANTDAWVHHLATVQGTGGQWYNNLPRPPIQTGDVGATALAIRALRRYPLPGRAAEFQERVRRGSQWLWHAKSQNADSLAYQLLGLRWAGEPTPMLQTLAQKLAALQRNDGGWAQLPGLESDAYATGQALYALRVAAGWKRTDTTVDRGLRYLLKTQLADGTWHVRRRAFPFQPTMSSGFPHGRDGWISAAASSWAVMAMTVGDDAEDTIAVSNDVKRTAMMR